MATNRDTDLVQLQAIVWCPGEHRLVVRVKKALVVYDPDYTLALIDANGENRKLFKNWKGATPELRAQYGDYEYALDREEGFPSEYHVFVWNPTFTAAQSVVPFRTRWLNKVHSWPAVLLDGLFHRPTGDPTNTWALAREYREGVTVSCRVKEEHFISHTPFPKRFTRCDEPRPGEVAYNSGRDSIPECLHPELKLPAPYKANLQYFDANPHRRGSNPLEARTVAATNHKAWKKHRIKSEQDLTFDDGLHYYVRWTIYPPKTGKVLKR